MHRLFSRRLSLLACAVVLASCGGNGGPAPSDSSSSVLSGHVYKGPTAGASVCAYAIEAGARGAQVAAQPGSTPSIVDGCVVTAADGAYSFILPAGTAGELLVESTGGTYCSDESTFDGTRCSGTGTPVAMGDNVLKTVVGAPATGTVNVPLTLLTTAAVQAAATLDASAFNTAYGTLAASFNAPADPASSPVSGDLTSVLQKLAVYVGPGTSDLAEILAGMAAGTLTAANTIFPAGIEFVAGADQKSARLFTVTSAGATLVSTASLPGIPGTYARSGTTVTVTMPNHGIRDGLWIPLQFAAGTGGAATSGTYKATVVDGDTFTVTDTASGTITGGTLYRDPVSKLAATYRQVEGDDFVTVTIPNHGLRRYDVVDLKFTTGGLADLSSQVSKVVDADTIEVPLSVAAFPTFAATLAAPPTVTVSGTAELSVGTNYSSFDAVMHPSGKWLYVASAYECWNGNHYCWGGDVITTLRIDWQRGKLTPIAAIRTQSGSDWAMPVKMAFNPAGTRMVHQDDDDDGLVLWNVDASTGALTRVAYSGQQHDRTTTASSSPPTASTSTTAHGCSRSRPMRSPPAAVGEAGNGGDSWATCCSSPGRRDRACSPTRLPRRPRRPCWPAPAPSSPTAT